MSNYDQLVIARDFRIRRTELTCPAHSLKMMTKAAGSDADEVILDLEDSCAVSQKVEARKTLVEALNTLDFKGKIRAFRPNNIRTKFFYKDVIEVVEAAGKNIDVMVLPKVYGPEDVKFADRLLTQIEQNMGLEIGRIKLEVLIESAEACLKAYEIATSTPRMAGLIFGIADFAGDIGAKELTKEQFQVYHYPKMQTIVAARAAGIDVIDNVTLQFRDLDQCRADAQYACKMGFDGKWAIHPDQIGIAHDVFSPTDAEVADAREAIETYRRSEAEGVGAIGRDGRLVDAAHMRLAENTLYKASLAAEEEPS